MLLIATILIGCTNQVVNPKSGSRIVLGTERKGWGGFRDVFTPFPIYAITTDGSGELDEKLPSNLGAEAEWSPDGKWIAFVARPFEDDGRALSLMRSDGSQQMSLGLTQKTRFDPKWSPDGMNITFYSASMLQHGVFGLNVECWIRGRSECKAQSTFLTQGFDPDWSPDGRRIAFANDQIFIMNVDYNGKQVNLTPTLSGCHNPDWSPDGQRIVFSCAAGINGTIYIAGADGSGLEKIYDGGFWPKWSPDGTRIAFVSTGGKRPPNLRRCFGIEYTEFCDAIYLMDPDGNSVIRLSQNNNEVVRWYTWVSSERR